MRKAETLKRYGLFIISLFFIGLGIGFAKHADLGISPISSTPNVMSIKFDFLSLGEWMLVANLLLLVGQILLLRRNFKIVQFLQIPLSFLFGYFTDLGVWIVRDIPNNTYIIKFVLLLISIVIIGFGVSLGVIANAILNSPEAFIKVIADKTKKEFGTIKVIFDVCWVLFAVILSLVFFNGKLMGIREGTVISAFLVGFVAKLFRPILQKSLTKFLTM